MYISNENEAAPITKEPPKIAKEYKTNRNRLNIKYNDLKEGKKCAKTAANGGGK